MTKIEYSRLKTRQRSLMKPSARTCDPDEDKVELLAEGDGVVAVLQHLRNRVLL